MIMKYMNLRTFFHPENWRADKIELFPCLLRVFWSSVYLVFSLAILKNIKLSPVFLTYLWLTPAISGYIWLSLAISGYCLSLAISGYLWVS